MIQKGTRFIVADNSGAKVLECINIIGSTRKRYAFLGERVKCSVKVAVPRGKVKKGDVVDAIIVRSKKEVRRLDGSYIRFSENAGVLINKGDGKVIGTRIFGPIGREVRNELPDEDISKVLEFL